MSWLSKLFHRETHEQWLAKHPGKESTTQAPVMNSQEEQDATRSRMEQEMDASRSERDGE